MLNTDTEYDAKIDAHLQNACDFESAGNTKDAEKEWKFAIFYEARKLKIDSKQYMAECCPAY